MQVSPIAQSVIPTQAETIPNRTNNVFSGTRFMTADRTTSVSPLALVAVRTALKRSADPLAE